MFSHLLLYRIFSNKYFIRLVDGNYIVRIKMVYAVYHSGTLNCDMQKKNDIVSERIIKALRWYLNQYFTKSLVLSRAS
jgi:hypothetical protein